jgi:hypothetical protein
MRSIGRVPLGDATLRYRLYACTHAGLKKRRPETPTRSTVFGDVVRPQEHVKLVNKLDSHAARFVAAFEAYAPQALALRRQRWQQR